MQKTPRVLNYNFAPAKSKLTSVMDALHSPELLRLAGPVTGDRAVLAQHCATEVHPGHLRPHLRHVHAMTGTQTGQVRSDSALRSIQDMSDKISSAIQLVA